MFHATAADLSSLDRPKRTSEVLIQLAANHAADRISVGDIVNGLGNRSFGVLLVAFAIPNLPPLGILGLSTVCAVPMIYLALQMLAAKPAPALPQWLHRRSLATLGEAHLRRILRSYGAYYNDLRTHLSLVKDAPSRRPIERSGPIIRCQILGGLHHQYVRE